MISKRNDNDGDDDDDDDNDDDDDEGKETRSTVVYMDDKVQGKSGWW